MEVIQAIEDQVQDEYLREKFSKSVAAAERTIDLYGCASALHACAPLPCCCFRQLCRSVCPPAASGASLSPSTAARTPQCSCTSCARPSRGTGSAARAILRRQAVAGLTRPPPHSRRTARTTTRTAQTSCGAASTRGRGNMQRTGLRLPRSPRSRAKRMEESQPQSRARSQTHSRCRPCDASSQRPVAVTRQQVQCGKSQGRPSLCEVPVRRMAGDGSCVTAGQSRFTAQELLLNYTRPLVPLGANVPCTA